MPQQIILAPLGMITQPNKLGQYPSGAMSLALNAYMRNPGTIESSRGVFVVANLSGAGTASNPEIWMMGFVGSSRAAVLYRIASGEWACTWFGLTGAGGGTDFLYNELGFATGKQYIPLDGRFGYATTGKHTVLTCALGVMAFDYTDPTTFAERAPRQAGLLPPRYMTTTTTASGTNAGALGTYKHAHCIAMQRRQYAGENYEMISAPCVPSHVYSNVSAANTYVNLTHTVFFETGFSKAGDIIEVYRTRSQTHDYSTTPETMVNTGADYFLSATHTLTAAEAAFGNIATLVDTTPDELLGDALYTNDGQQGGGAAAFVPPTSKSVAKFKGYTFYLNNTEAPQFKFRPSGSWSISIAGDTSAFRKNNFGNFNFVGSITAGGTTVTGISAADIVGLVVGQNVFSGPAYPTTPGVITAVGVSTITVTPAATGAVTAASWVATDIIEIDGTRFPASNLSFFAVALAQDTTARYTSFLLACQNPQLNPLYSFQPTLPADFLTVKRRSFWGDPTLSATRQMSVRATHGDYLRPALPRINAAEAAQVFAAKIQLNGVYWSEENQPENVPPDNFAFCGSGEIYASASTRDALWIFASDGLWRLSGTGGQAGRGFDWRIDPVDSTLSISGPQALCVLRDTVYAYTNRGFVSIDSNGTIREISSGRLGDLLPGPPWSGATVTGATAIFLTADIENDEVRFQEPGNVSGRSWIYNCLTDSFTQDTHSLAGGYRGFNGVYVDALRCVLLGMSGGGGQVFSLNATTYRSMDLTFQPVYSDSPFVQRHWQNINVATDDATATVDVYLNGSGTSIGQKTLTPGGTSIYSRQGWMVPRNGPAVSNNLAVRVVGQDALTAPLRVQGVAIGFTNITEQRVKR